MKWQPIDYELVAGHYRRLCWHQWLFTGLFLLMVLFCSLMATAAAYDKKPVACFVQAFICGFCATQAWRAWSKWRLLKRIYGLFSFVRKAQANFRESPGSIARQHWLEQTEAAVADYNRVVTLAGYHHELAIQMQRKED